MRIAGVIWTDLNEEHIARHGVRREEVEEAMRNDPFVTKNRRGTYRPIRQTDGGRYLTVILAPRDQGLHYVVTARDADSVERRSYQRR